MPWLGYGQDATDQTCLSPGNPSLLAAPAKGDLQDALAALQKTAVLPTVANNVAYPGLDAYQKAISCWVLWAVKAMTFTEGLPSTPGVAARGLTVLREAKAKNPAAWADIATQAEVDFNEAKRHLIALIREAAQARQISAVHVPTRFKGWQQPTVVETNPEGIPVPLAPWTAGAAAVPPSVERPTPPTLTYVLDNEAWAFMPYRLIFHIEGEDGTAPRRTKVLYFAVHYTIEGVWPTGTTVGRWMATPNAGFWLAFKDTTDLIWRYLTDVEEAYGRILNAAPVSPGTGTTPPPSAPPAPPPDVTQPPQPPRRLLPALPRSTKDASWPLLVVAAGATGLAIWGFKNRQQLP